MIPHILGPATAQHRGLQLHADPMGDVAESYRTVRTSLYFGPPAGEYSTIPATLSRWVVAKSVAIEQPTHAPMTWTRP